MGEGEKNHIRIKRDFMSLYILCAVFLEGISETYYRINYESFPFISLPVHLLSPHLPYPIYFEIQSDLSAEQNLKL